MHFCEHKLLRHVLKALLKDLLDSYNICVRGSQCFYVKENDEYGDAIPSCDYNLYYLCGRRENSAYVKRRRTRGIVSVATNRNYSKASSYPKGEKVIPHEKVWQV